MASEQYTREQLNEAVWAATGGDLAGAVRIAEGWERDAIQGFAAPLRAFVDQLDLLAAER